MDSSVFVLQPDASMWHSGANERGGHVRTFRNIKKKRPFNNYAIMADDCD